MFTLSRTQLLVRAILCFGIGLLILWIGTSVGDASGAWYFTLMFFIPGSFFLVWRHFKGVADRRAAQAVQAGVAPKRPIAPPKASPDSSSLELPDFD